MDTRHTHDNREEGQHELLVRELKVEEESLPAAKRREAMSAQREGRSIDDGDREVVHGHALFECEKETWRAIGTRGQFENSEIFVVWRILVVECFYDLQKRIEC
jgi:hypothetical protein